MPGSWRKWLAGFPEAGAKSGIEGRVIGAVTPRGTSMYLTEHTVRQTNVRLMVRTFSVTRTQRKAVKDSARAGKAFAPVT